MRKVKGKNQDTNKMTLAYKGNVTVKVVRDNEVVKVVNGHNAGTFRLFEFIAKCLAGLYEPTYGPKYIQCFKASTSSPDLSELVSLSGVIPLSSTTYETSVNSSSAKLTFTIPGDAFPENAEVNYFALYNYKEYSNQANPMATYFSEDTLDNIDKNSNVIVVWELQIANIEA